MNLQGIQSKFIRLKNAPTQVINRVGLSLTILGGNMSRYPALQHAINRRFHALGGAEQDFILHLVTSEFLPQADIDLALAVLGRPEVDDFTCDDCGLALMFCPHAEGD